MKRYLIILVLSACPLFGFSQEYDLEAGVRSGLGSGITFRVHTGMDNWLEGMLLNRDNGVQLYVLKGKTVPLAHTPVIPLSLQTAFGAHAGSTRSLYYPGESMGYFRLLPVVGADFYMALSYQFNRFPCSLSVDYKPFAELVPDRFIHVNLWDFGFTLRYQFTTKKQ
ncbi:hypothetical protein SDC9_116972 [bioreactor metagenome]|uniref:Outer membrane protein beta-barrel domain-containing protein n=1 Tax=bioreactor metagenome TaxID=1076179 RepID=A0A645BZB5_9ZZZZ